MEKLKLKKVKKSNDSDIVIIRLDDSSYRMYDVKSGLVLGDFFESTLKRRTNLTDKKIKDLSKDRTDFKILNKKINRV